MQNQSIPKVLVIGAGLAGSEASMFLARNGVKVVLAEAKTIKLNSAQKISTFAELVCTNSLKSLDPQSAHGLLKTEMEELGLPLRKRESTATWISRLLTTVERPETEDAASLPA